VEKEYGGKVAADGPALKIVIIVPGKTTEMKVLEHGYGPGQVIIEYHGNGFIMTVALT
jgi:hypothetical protein